MGSNPIFSAIYRGIAQLVEQWSPKPRAVGSSPTAPAIYLSGYTNTYTSFRGVAQFGSATGLGPVGRGFKSCHPDHFNKTWAISSVGQSVRLITGRSWVQVPDGPPKFNIGNFAQIAQ